MYKRRGVYFFVRGKEPWQNLGRDYRQALISYAGLVGERPTITTIQQAVAHYLETSSGRLKPKSLETYRYNAVNVCEIFGHMALDALQPEHVYEYLVRKGNVQANRDKALLSAVYSHARRIGAFKGDDPTKKLQFRNPEKPRDRYVTDDELDKLSENTSRKLNCIMQFSFLTGQRQSDVVKVKLVDLKDDGIHVTVSKTGARIVIDWTDALKACVQDAHTLWKRETREHLFESHPRGKHAKRGPGPYTTSGLRSLWRVAREKAGLNDVTLHDLRRKAGSDLPEADATRLLAHQDAKVTKKHYRAKPERVKPAR